MGISNSHEAVPDCDQATPPKPEGRRILAWDPRSPSGDISRTPIVVDKTPDGMLESQDPRSPTVGIARTPLAYLPTHSTASASVTSAPVPKIDLNQDLEVTDPMTPVVDTSPGAGDPLMDPLGVTDIQNMSLDDLPSCESTRLVPLDEDKTPDTVDTEIIKIKKKKTKSTQPKELFPQKKGSGLKDMTRSPLSTRNVDMNSPLSIVQRKQIKDMDLKRNCSVESSMSRFIVKDKENM